MCIDVRIQVRTRYCNDKIRADKACMLNSSITYFHCLYRPEENDNTSIAIEIYNFDSLSNSRGGFRS